MWWKPAESPRQAPLALIAALGLFQRKSSRMSRFMFLAPLPPRSCRLDKFTTARLCASSPPTVTSSDLVLTFYTFNYTLGIELVDVTSPAEQALTLRTLWRKLQSRWNKSRVLLCRDSIILWYSSVPKSHDNTNPATKNYLNCCWLFLGLKAPSNTQ